MNIALQDFVDLVTSWNFHSLAGMACTAHRDKPDDRAAANIFLVAEIYLMIYTVTYTILTFLPPPNKGNPYVQD